MFKRNSKLYLDDIKTAIDKIEKYTAGLSFEEFIQNIMAIDAVIRNLTVIGEAAKNIPEEIKSENPDVMWNEAVGMRNKAIHEYFGIDEEILWKTIKDDLPVFKEQILGLIEEL